MHSDEACGVLAAGQSGHSHAALRLARRDVVDGAGVRGGQLVKLYAAGQCHYYRGQLYRSEYHGSKWNGGRGVDGGRVQLDRGSDCGGLRESETERCGELLEKRCEDWTRERLIGVEARFEVAGDAGAVVIAEHAE